MRRARSSDAGVVLLPFAAAGHVAGAGETEVPGSDIGELAADGQHGGVGTRVGDGGAEGAEVGISFDVSRTFRSFITIVKKQMDLRSIPSD